VNGMELPLLPRLRASDDFFFLTLDASRVLFAVPVLNSMFFYRWFFAASPPPSRMGALTSGSRLIIVAF